MCTLRPAAVAACLALLTAACSVQRLDDREVGAGSAAGAGDDPGITSTTVAGDQSTSTTVAGTPDAAFGTGGPAGPGSTAGGGSSVSRTGPTGPGRAPTGNSTSTEARRASAPGVSTGEVVLGLLSTSEDFFASAGFGGTKRHEPIIKPFIDEINANGGINGRKVVARVTRYDPLSADSMQAACVNQAEDLGVFTSIAQAGFYGDAEVCMANKKVPLLTSNNSSANTNYERERGFVRQTQMNKDRNLKSWIDWMISAKLLTPQTKTGLLWADVPEDRQVVREVVVPYLRSKGMQAPVEAVFSQSIAQTPSESQSAVLRFSSEDVKLVLPMLSFLRMLIFTQQAEAASYRPQYSVSDFGLLATDATAGFPPAQWNGVRGITALRTGEYVPGQAPTTPAFKDCEATYNKYGEKLARDPDDPNRPEAIELTNMIHYCQHIALWADAARRAGVNPTRDSFLQALGSTGTWSHRVLLTERLTFTPTKYDGADLIATVRWQPGCTSDGGCYRQIEGFRRATH